MFGICLGHQILGLALGGDDVQAEVRPPRREPPGEEAATAAGSRSPRRTTGSPSIPSRCRHDVEVTHLNLYDGTVEGLRHATQPVFCVQYHPEAVAGPARRGLPVRQFLDEMERARGSGLEARAQRPETSQPKPAPTYAKRTDLKRVLVIGSGPIVIGQACEFDYSGTQACKALRAEGLEVVLVNSNPATIMTDPELADRTYVEPLTPEVLEAIIERERPDALLPTVGGQTALNLAVELAETRHRSRSTTSS